MDTGSLVPKHKRKKLNGKDGTHGRDKCLNDLSDTILKHILSFLGTRKAVRTSVLCKRWRYMWPSLPNLEFLERDRQGYEYGERKQFMDFVDRVIHLHESPNIQKISLNCEVKDDDFSRVNTWIHAAVMRNVQEFDFNLYTGDENANAYAYAFPDGFFGSEVMEVLKISVYNGAVRLPSEIFLPRLKILTLDNFTPEDHHLTNLLLASPALEELTIKDCKWIGHSSELIISAPKLRSLTIDDNYQRFSNTVTISAPELKFFKYKGEFLNAYHLPFASSIYKATFDSCFSTSPNTDNFDEVLRSLHLVEHLQVSNSFVEAMSRATVPIFKNLISLEISVESGSSKQMEVLNKCPHLETLKLPMGISKNCDIDPLLNSKFSFLSSLTLKSITIGVFKGNLVETFVVKFFLAKSTSLETMENIFCEAINVSARKHMENVLSSMPRASESCKLDLHFARAYFF